MSRIPIRIRITLGFALAMALLLTALGLFVYLRHESQLNHTIDQGLRSRAQETAAAVERTGAGLRNLERTQLIESDESVAEVLTPAGDVIDSSPQLGGEPVLTPEQARSSMAGPRFYETADVPGIEGAVRLLATRAETGAGEVVVVVGSSLDDRDESLDSLATLLLVGGPVALLLASLAGFAVATAALRPVEAMRQRAAALSAADLEQRLPLSDADDELRRLGETLNAMLGRLQTAIERERTFVDDASHELRTPLTLHKTELELALRYATTTAELRAAIASAIEEADRLAQLAEDLLVVARSEKGRLPLQPERIVAEHLLADVATRFEARAVAAGRELEVRAPAEPLTLEADRLRLEQALTNLVDNALRHGRGEVRLRAERNDGGVALHVEDRGPGFPPDFIDRAFDRFTRADASRARGGTGLGLAIVDVIATAHRGHAGARNRAHGGADVWIELPLDLSS